MKGGSFCKSREAEIDGVGWAVEEVGSGFEVAADGFETIVASNGKAGEVEMVIDMRDEGRGAFTGMEYEDTDLAGFSETAQEIEQIALTAREDLAAGGKIIDDKQAGIGRAGDSGIQVLQTFFGGQRARGVAEMEIGSIDGIGARGEEAFRHLLERQV